MGLRFCGMVLDEPRPCANGSYTSPTSVCIISLTSIASLPSVPVTRPRKQPTSAIVSRSVCQAITGCARPSSFINPAWVSSPPWPREASVPAAPANSPISTRGRSSARRARCRSIAERSPAILYPKVTGTACCRLLRPIIGVSRWRRASSAIAAEIAVRSSSMSARPSRICSTVAVSVMSWVVAPQWHHSPRPSAHSSTSCWTTPSTGLPKMAESMMVAGMFCGSCSGRGCFGDRRRVHGQPAFMVAGPQVKRPAVRLRLAADEEGVEVEDRAHSAELELRDSRIRSLPAQQIDEERGDQRTVDDQARVALDLRYITAIVVDAVAVERERRIAEEERLIRHPLLLPGGCGGRGLRRGSDIGRLRRLAVDDVVKLGQRDVVLAVGTELMPDFYEHQRTAAAGFFVDALDRRHARDRVAHAQRPVELQLAAGPHAPGQRYRGQEPAAPGVAVRADFGLAVQRQEIQPMPQRRQGRARLRSCRFAVQGRRERRIRHGGDDVVHRFSAADPVFQVHGAFARSSARITLPWATTTSGLCCNASAYLRWNSVAPAAGLSSLRICATQCSRSLAGSGLSSSSNSSRRSISAVSALSQPRSGSLISASRKSRSGKRPRNRS